MSFMILEVRGLIKKYGRLKAINKLSFDVEKGKVYGILGPNGSGKSTTLGILLGVINISSGYFKWFEGSLLSNALKKIGAIIEQPNFYPYMSGQQNLKLICKIKNLSTQNLNEKLELVGLLQRKKDKFKNYSLGMKQRLAIAASLLNNPEVLILDEPTNGLDPDGIHQIRKLIAKISSSGTTVLLASHLLGEVEKVCSEVIIIDKGKKIYEGSISELSFLKSRFEIKVAQNEKNFEDFLEHYEGIKEFKKENDFYFAYLKENTNPAEFSKAIFKEGFLIEHFCLKKPSLEQQFITLTKS